jgi:branched-chain amino acid transport system substrate-binding protein
MDSPKSRIGLSDKLAMNFSSRKAILAFSCVVFSLIGPLIFWLSDRQKHSSSIDVNQSLDKYLSSGEKVLVTLDDSPDKEIGTERFRNGKFDEAIAHFSSALKRNRNDPESWIYLNNARALASGNPVKIAVAVPIGNNVNVAKEILRGVAQYQEEINQGARIKGRLLQIAIVNDNNDPELGKHLANKIAQDVTILGAIGHQSSDVSVAVAPIYERSGIVMISPTSYARELSGIGKFIFRTTPSSRVFADTLAKYAIKTQRLQKFAICFDSKSRASQSFKEDFTAAVYAEGAQVTRTVCDFSAPDFNPDEITTRATTDGATSLLLTPGVEQLKQAIAVIQANKGRLSLIGSQSLYTFETLQQGHNAANGITLAVPWEPSGANGSIYAQNARQLWGGLGNWRTAMAYDATKTMVTGLNTGLNRQQLQKSLSNPGFSVSGVTGIVQFLPTGDRNQTGRLVKILPGKVSGTGYDFIPLKSAEGLESVNEIKSPTKVIGEVKR